MHINVTEFLAKEVGYNRTFKISGERPDLESVKLTQDLEGELTISRLESGLMVEGRIATEIELECHRCLRTFTRPTSVKLSQLYSEQPADEDMPIEDGDIDVAPLIEQEILVHLPIKILCRLDCPGVEGAAKQYTKEESGNRIQDQARITKGP